MIPTERLAYHQRAMLACAHAAQWSDALDHATQASALAPENANFWLAQAQLHDRLGHDRETIAVPSVDGDGGGAETHLPRAQLVRLIRR